MERFWYIVLRVIRLTYTQGLIRFSNCARLSRLGNLVDKYKKRCTEIQVSSHNTYVYFVLDNSSPMSLLIIGHTRCHLHTIIGKTYVKRPLLKYHNLVFEGQLSLNAGQKYCRMLSILQYFRPLLSYHLALRSLFCRFLKEKGRRI